ncbi:MAG: 30S ribosomal protein S1 [Synechococcus sp. SB0668_bin_15]|nr:30S ribosomal protein S1 [Synechococcus sp. SB0668_bin_15]MYC50064.1 30S ribosomal protein S1 [Synechococcus sp. SB0662_bin_14]
MKAKDVKRPTDRDVGLSILKINKSEARQQAKDGSPPTGSPPTEGPPTPPVNLDAPPDPVLESAAGLPSYTPRNVDDVDFDEEAFQSALAGSASGGAKGEEVCGTVISHESDGVYVDIGGKAPGWLPKREFGFGVVTDMAAQFPQGKQLKVLVTGEQNAEGMVTVSCRALMVRDSWTTVTRLAQEAAVVQAVISGFNRGGCTCTVEGLRGFIPRSQLVDGDNHSALVGKTLGVIVLEANPKTSKLVLSEKQASRAQRFAQLNVGDLVTGQISGLKRFGCFVDLGPISGLLHQRCISAGHIRDLREVFTMGETISALVTDVDAARGRIALNTALLEKLPGELLVAKAEVIGQAEQRAERARAALLQEQQQEQQAPLSGDDSSA